MKLSDLRDAPYNPRRIIGEALEGLKYSLGEFGDISGIVFNETTGHLVAGHQRVRALREQYGDLEIIGGRIRTPVGETFPVRIVSWSLAKEQAANIAANSPTIEGEFTDDLGALLDGVRDETPELFAGLNLDALEMPDRIGDEGNEEEMTKIVLPVPYQKVHVLISVAPDKFAEIADLLQEIKRNPHVEYDQSAN